LCQQELNSQLSCLFSLLIRQQKTFFNPRALSSFSSNCSCFNARGRPRSAKKKLARREGMRERERKSPAAALCSSDSPEQKRERRKLLKELYAQPLVK